MEPWHKGTLTVADADREIADYDADELERLARKAVDGVKWDQLTDEQRKAARARNALAAQRLAGQRQAVEGARQERSNRLHRAEVERRERLGDTIARKHGQYGPTI